MAQTAYVPYTQFSNLAVSGTNTYTSNTTTISRLHNVGIQVTFTGTMTGTFSVNCSNDNVNFIALTFNPALSQPAGSNISYLIDLNQLPFAYLQVQYVNSSGSGTLTSILTAKDLG